MGDANTKNFHSFTSTRRNFNAIWALHNDDGLLLNEECQIKSLGVKHFLDMFKDDGSVAAATFSQNSKNFRTLLYFELV